MKTTYTMEKEEILSGVSRVICRVLNKEALQITPETTAHDVDGWDSLSNMKIISETEKAFGMKFKLREIVRMKNVKRPMRSIRPRIRELERMPTSE